MEKIKPLIEKAIEKGCISIDLSFIPSEGAREQDILEEERKSIRPFTFQHKEFLKIWNGANLDLIKFYGCGNAHKEISKISEWQMEVYDDNPSEAFPDLPYKDLLVIGDTPFGEVIIEDKKGSIYMLNFDGLLFEKVASSLEEFICDYVFGKRAEEFGGEEWLQELKDAGLA
jgi:hypothetical protein